MRPDRLFKEVWEFGSLEAWLCFPRRHERNARAWARGAALPPPRRTENGEQSAPAGRRAKPPSIHSIFGTSQTCRGCGENEGAWPCHPCRGVGQRPATPLISESAKIPFVYLCGSSCSSCFPQNTPPLSIAPPVARLSRVPFSVLRSPFSILRFPFSGATQSPSISPMEWRCAKTPFCVLGGAMAAARSRSSGRALAMATE